MTDEGMHDSLVWQVLERLPVPVEQRARHQITEYVARAKAVAAAQQRGVQVASSDRRSLADQFDDEADRLLARDAEGDPQRQLREASRSDESGGLLPGERPSVIDVDDDPDMPALAKPPLQ